MNTTHLTRPQEHIIRNASAEEVQEYIKQSLSNTLDIIQKEVLITVIYLASQRLNDNKLYTLVEHLENEKGIKSTTVQNIIFELISNGSTAGEITRILSFVYAKISDSMIIIRILDYISKNDAELTETIKPVALRKVQTTHIRKPLEIINYFDIEWQIRALNAVAYSENASTEIITAIGKISNKLTEDSSLRFLNGALQKMLNKRPDKLEAIFEIIESFINRSHFCTQNGEQLSEDVQTIIRLGVEVFNQAEETQDKNGHQIRSYCLVAKAMQCRWGNTDWQSFESFIEAVTKLDVLRFVTSPHNNQKLVKVFVEKWRKNNPDPTSAEEADFNRLLKRYDIQ